ncbi:MAG: hypothetical protein NVSMB18_18030 [Acetobacteraceae bacterium]
MVEPVPLADDPELELLVLDVPEPIDCRSSSSAFTSVTALAAGPVSDEVSDPIVLEDDLDVLGELSVENALPDAELCDPDWLFRSDWMSWEATPPAKPAIMMVSWRDSARGARCKRRSRPNPTEPGLAAARRWVILAGRQLWPTRPSRIRAVCQGPGALS